MTENRDDVASGEIDRPDSELGVEQFDREQFLDEVASQILRPQIRCLSCSHVVAVVIDGQRYCPACAKFKGVGLCGEGGTLPGVTVPPSAYAASNPEPGGVDPGPTPEEQEATLVKKVAAAEAMTTAQKMRDQTAAMESHVMAQAKILTVRLLRMSNRAVEKAHEEIEKGSPTMSTVGDLMSAAHLAIKLADEADAIGDKAGLRRST